MNMEKSDLPRVGGVGLTVIDGSTEVRREAVGGKAFYLNELFRLRMNVPPTVVLPILASDQALKEHARWPDGFLSGEAWRLAVRSSSAFEDSQEASAAGHYTSLLGEFDDDSLVEAVHAVRQSGPAMAVIIQPLLSAAYAGVAFSCDPITYARDSYSITWTYGLSNRLVAGEETGYQVTSNPQGDLLDGSWPADALLLRELAAVLGKVESLLAAPADIEWVIDEAGRLWIVQARPVVLPRAGIISLERPVDFERLPPVIRHHHKIRLRHAAISRNITMPLSVVEVSSGRGEPAEGPRFAGAAAVSVVLLYPERIQNEVVREFAPVQGTDVDFFAKSCRRYAVRRYPKIGDISAARKGVLDAGLAMSWIAVAGLYTVWNAHATGIIRKVAEGYLIDIALGHFVPKGVVSTSTIMVSFEGTVLSASWREQELIYHFVDGHVVTETQPFTQLHLPDSVLASICAALDPMFEVYPDAALEFGLVERTEELEPYLIDVAEGDRGSARLDHTLIASGVMSIGRCDGRLTVPPTLSKSTLDSHMQNRPDRLRIDDENVVIVADRATVDLLPLVGAPGITGFVFRQGAVLAHLAVVLREHGIPAIVLDDSEAFAKLPVGECVTLDALTPQLTRTERVVRARR